MVYYVMRNEQPAFQTRKILNIMKLFDSYDMM